jgi:hypothetical protein
VSNYQNVKNKIKIYRIVKNHFSLTEKSLELFKFRLFYEPHIAPEYARILDKFATKDDPLRARIELHDNIDLLSKTDKGWRIFKDYFSPFINHYNMTYSDFKENKIIIDKQHVKLMKAITHFYETHNDTDSYYRVSRGRIERIFEEIGKYKITRKGIELVLSLNFADWFLCSTGDNWGSCLSLESGYEDCFWAGLPGLIGDKNRALLYLTDGKTKSYEDIIIDRLLNRSWTLTIRKRANNLNRKKRSETKIFVVNEYPNFFELAKIMEEIVDGSFTNKIGGDAFISRYYIENLFHKRLDEKGGITSYIYQDNTRNIVAKKNKATAHPGAYSYLKIGGGGGVCRYDENGREYSGNTFFFDGGLSNLIRQKMNLNEAYDYENGYTCDECGERLNEDYVFWGPDDISFCERCYNNICTECNECSHVIYTEDAIKTRNGFVCEYCFNEYYFECEDCGEVLLKEDGVYVENANIHICQNCFKENTQEYYKCDKCFCVFEKDGKEIYIEEDDKYFCCNSCRDNHYNVRQTDLFNTKKAS